MFAGSLSDFIGPNPDYRGQTPSRTRGRDSGSEERKRLEVDTVKREQQEMKSPSSPSSSSSASSAVPSPLSNYRQSSGDLSGGRTTRPPRNRRTTSNQSPRIAHTSSSTSSPQSLSPSQPASPRSNTSLAASPRSSVSKGAQEEYSISPNRLARSLSQPNHTLISASNAAPSAGGASLAGLPSQSSNSLRPPHRAGTSMSHHPPPATAAAAPPKSFGQSLYQFLMTKPTGASAAASGGRGGSASFTATGTHALRGRGMPSNSKVHSSSGLLESSTARRREEKDREDRSR